MQKPGAGLWAELEWSGSRLRVDLGAGTPIAIPLQPGGPQPAFFAPFPMEASALQLGGFTGDVHQGGSCNVSVLTWAPHCHGTHTECVGHILPESGNVAATIDNRPGPARLISLKLAEAGTRVSLEQLQDSLPEGPGDNLALVIRSLPNTVDKLSRNYDRDPDYLVLDSDCMQWLADSKLQHLLLDTPSLDASNDSRLSNHRAWWGLDGGNPASRYRSVTEMIFVPDELPDGEYWLHLELSPLVSDATPSRPVLYPLQRI